MAESDDGKRREALKKLRQMRGAAGARPGRALTNEPQGSNPGRAAGGQGGGGQGGDRREKLRALLKNRGGAGGGLGGGGGGFGGGAGGKLRDALKARGIGEPPPGGRAAPGGEAAGERPMLRRILQQRRQQGGGTAEGGGGAATGGGLGLGANLSPEEKRAKIKERIEKLQAQLETLESGEVEDATLVDDDKEK